MKLELRSKKLELLLCVLFLTSNFLVLTSDFAHAQPPLIRVAVNMTTVESAPVFVAARDAADVRINLRSGGIPMLLDGDADAATNSETQALLRSVARPDLRIVMTVAECYYRIVARKSAGIRRLADLRGKKIGAPANTSSGYHMAIIMMNVQLAET